MGPLVSHSCLILNRVLYFYNYIIKMENKGSGAGRSTYSYYDYTKQYSPRFLNQYQSHAHWWSGRGSHFLELLRLKSVRMKSNRNWMWFDLRYGTKFLFIFYLP